MPSTDTLDCDIEDIPNRSDVVVNDKVTSSVELERIRRRELRETRAAERTKRRLERLNKNKKNPSLLNDSASGVLKDNTFDELVQITAVEIERSVTCSQREHTYTPLHFAKDDASTAQDQRENQESETMSSMNSEPGFFHHLLQSSVNIVHLCHLIGGCTLLGYGIALSAHKTDTQRFSAALCYIWSTVLILASTLGITGLISPRCKRIGLSISTYLAPPLILWDLALVSFLMIEKKHILEHISTHKHSYYLTSKEISILEENFTLFALSLIIAAMVELCRYYTLLTLKDDLEFYDAALLVESRGEEARQRIAARRRWTKNPSEESATPLLSGLEEEEGTAGRGEGFKTNVTFPGEEKHRRSWWEDEDDSAKNGDSEETRAWLPELFQLSKKNQSSARSSAFGDESSAGDAFAPIEEDMDLESLGWIKEKESNESSISVEEMKPPDFHWANDEDSVSSDPDLSWTKEP